MAAYQFPGPLCRGRQPGPIDGGTLMRRLTPAPGTLGVCFWFEPPTALPDPFAQVDDLSFLFSQCRNPKTGLGDADYQRAATALGVEVAAIQAVAEVETQGAAFDESGRPRILYERHYFHRLTAGKYSVGHPTISKPAAGGYGKFSAQYGKLEQAYRLDADAALRSASWGRFQIMGDNYSTAGFASVRAFVLAMARAESAHLDAFTRFVVSHKKMLAALRKKEWAAFAAAYNGPGYRKNQYDEKMAAAYKRFAPKPAAVPPAKP